MNRPLAWRIFGSLAVKALPALYGAGFILFVLRVVPPGDFGRYAIANAYVTLVAGISRGLWLASLVGQSAIGQERTVIGPVFWYATGTALLGGVGGLILLPLLHCGWTMALIAAIMLLVLVPRDLAFGLAQAQSRVAVAFFIEAAYFLGSLAGFFFLWQADLLQSAEFAMGANIAAALLAMLTGVLFFPILLRPTLHGRFRDVLFNARWFGLATVCDMGLQQGDALIGGLFFTPEKLAPYLAARTLLKMYSLFSQAINFLAFPVAARLSARGEYRKLKTRLRQSLSALLVLLIPVNIVLWYACDSLFPWLLGEKYVAAIPYFRILIFVTFLEPVYSVVANAMVAAGRARKIGPWLVAGITLNIVLNLTLMPTIGISGALAALLVSYGFLAVAFYLLAKRSFIHDEPPAQHSSELTAL
jgi:O-antigen/teichoic acid export membrane protein